MDVPQTFYFLAVPNLGRARYQNSEHLESLIFTEIEGRMGELPLATCCDGRLSLIDKIELIEMRLLKLIDKTALGFFVIRFDEISPTGVKVLHHVRFTFELYLLDEQLKMLCAEAAPSDFTDL